MKEHDIEVKTVDLLYGNRDLDLDEVQEVLGLILRHIKMNLISEQYSDSSRRDFSLEHEDEKVT